MDMTRPYRVELRRRRGWFWGVAAASVSILTLAGCHTAEVTETTKSQAPPIEPGVRDTPFGLYSTLSGKMARLEELLNAIDRLLETPGLQQRVLRDAHEFHQLLQECRGLYPANLPVEDRGRYDLAIGQALALSHRLRDAIHADDARSARQAIAQIIRQREQAHSRYSPGR